MPECGATQAKLLELGDGRNEHTPCKGVLGATLWCGEADVSDWRARADLVFSLIRKEWNRLVRTDTGRHENVRAITTDYEDAYAVLPDASWTNAFGLDNAAIAVEHCVQNIRQGACVLELIERELKAAGEHTINPGRTLTKDPSSIPGWVWAAALAGAVWVLLGTPPL